MDLSPEENARNRDKLHRAARAILEWEHGPVGRISVRVRTHLKDCWTGPVFDFDPPQEQINGVQQPANPPGKRDEIDVLRESFFSKEEREIVLCLGRTTMTWRAVANACCIEKTKVRLLLANLKRRGILVANVHDNTVSDPLYLELARKSAPEPQKPPTNSS